MVTEFGARQMVSRDTLDQIANNESGVEVDDLLRSIDEELTVPLRMRATSTPDLVLNIENITVTNPEHSRKRTIPPINNVLPPFTSGTVTFPATNNNNITNDSGGPAVLLNITAGHYVKAGININTLGQIVVTLGESNAAAASTGTPAVPTGTFAIGFVIVQNAAGNISNVENTNIYQYMGGGGGGSGTGDSNSIIETIKNHLINSPFNLVTPNIASVDEDTLISAFGGTAEFSTVDSAWKFPAASDSITSEQMLDADRFLDEYKDLTSIRLVAFWDESAIDTGATYQVSRDGGSHYADVSMERIDDTEVYHGDYDWNREEEDEVTDSNATGSGNTALSDVAGSTESLAAKFSFTNESRATALRAKLKKVTAGTLAGNFRFAIFSDDGSGKPGVRQYTTAWQVANNASGAGDDYSITVDFSGLAGGDDYFLVVETDSTYKAGYSSGVEELQWIRNTSGTNEAFSLDGSTWSAIATAQFVFQVTAGEESFSTVNEYDVANATNTNELDATTDQLVSQAFTTTSTQVVKKASLYMSKEGAPSGGMYVRIVRDDSGDPSDDIDDLLCESNIVLMSDLSTGDITVEVDMPNVALPAGTYHLVVRTDDDYKASYTGSIRIKWRGDDTSPPVAGKRNNGTAWSALATPMNFCYKLEGRPLDLRVKVISSGSDALLNGYGIFYDHDATGVSGGTKKIKVERFKAVADNTSTFTIPWVADPDLLKVYYAEAGQVFVWPAFEVNGYDIVFPDDTFNNGGVEADITLIITQNEGTSFDNSDANGNLLAQNFLGSSNSAFDKSVAGRGIKLRNTNGDLREAILNENDEWEIYSVS